MKEKNEILNSTKPSKLNQQEVNYLNSPQTNEIKIVIKTLPAKTNKQKFQFQMDSQQSSIVLLKDL